MFQRSPYDQKHYNFELNLIVEEISFPLNNT